MMLMTEAPQLPAPLCLAAGVTTSDGELLAALQDEPAGAWLAVMLDGINPASLSTMDLPTRLQACRRLANWVDAQTTATVAELSRREDCPAPQAEVALALCEPRGSAEQRVWWSARLTRLLPKVWSACRVGDLSAAHAHEVVKATARLTDPDQRGTVEERVLKYAEGKTPRELGRHARNVVRSLDPKAANDAAKAARDQADVTVYPDQDGMADVIAHQPVEDAAIVKAGVDAFAMTAKNAGDPRPVGVLRAEGLTRMVSDYLAGRSSQASPPRSGGRPIEIGITLDLPTALGHRDLPGEVPGRGIVPRDVIATMIARELPKLRLLVIDEATGRLLHRATNSYRPTPDQIAHVAATYIHSAGPGSSVMADRCDTDHITAWPDGATVIGNLAPLDRSWHNDKTLRSLRVTIDDSDAITVTTPLGQTRTVAPYDYRPLRDETAAEF